ncbi:hypothetical protein [Lactobacillus sp. ESL0677]|uniref:hypothetical protein n=1 Tax=Lactobacillus sp. ESL0677 TaxID=2983208 RepID=UPI0023F85592|nr:hypothetical protein [Lactobacillus sp. ESL0677]WEV36213.1 hypothetical protein OZX76_05555 [Lactobacillus sp. ESL0677]
MLIKKQFNENGVLPDDLNEQDYFVYLDVMRARERMDRAELNDPADALKNVERRYLGNAE